MTFNTAVIDQDQILSDLSMRTNLSWFPSDWNQVAYPQTMTIDITWSPALEVDQVITGNNGAWTWTLVAPGHLRLTRTGAFNTSGFQPEPEVLLKKPTSVTTVTATFTASAPNTPSVTRTATTTSYPY